MPDAWLAIAVVFAGVYYAALLAALRLPRRRIFVDGDFASGLRWSRFARVLLGKRANRFLIPALEYSGRTGDAVGLAEQWAREPLAVTEVNACVNAFVNGGRYAQAVELAATLENRGREDGEWGLVQVNTAEAEHNLGRSADALARLDRLRAGLPPQGIIDAGECSLRAWIYISQGRTDDAATALAAARMQQLPHIFHAELHFTRAALSLATGDAKAALAATDAGLAVARRASSVRNGVFLRARCLASAGETAAALAEFQRGAAMAYVGQGGDALLAWGDLLAQQQRHDEAKAAWQLAISRDPESAAAAVAQQRAPREAQLK